jgi:transcriptional antiterminator RfaH
MDWYVIHTKPRQESRALFNLASQGYKCFLPMIPRQKIKRGLIDIEQEALFPRYLFIQLDSNQSGKSWGPIRSTLGVSKLLTFGGVPAKAPKALVNVLRESVEQLKGHPTKLFQAGDRLHVRSGPFAGLEAVFEMEDGASRAMVLIELLSRPTRITLPMTSLSKAN